ncbi:MAG: HupE/UreJ family protein [Janthinobacterium lividum]
MYPAHFLRYCLAWLLVAGLLGAWPRLALAHPVPSSVVLLDIKSTGVGAELQLPLGELQLAFGHDVALHPETLVARLGPQLRAYIQAHVRPIGTDGRPWAVTVGALGIKATEQSYTGPFQTLTAQLWLQPLAGTDSRTFTLHYDVIVHQVVTHKTLVSIRQDWDAGVVATQPVEAGVIQLDPVNNVVPPLEIQQQGSWWRGFGSMVRLGMAHIAEGTDHLLFLLVLLLPAPLLVLGGRWAGFGGVRYSLGRVLRIVTAFTLGHSLTLLAGAVGWLRLPGQPVEALIAVSILVGAVHAIRPLFAGREAYVAGGFGLVHGLAFASTLAGLQLDATRMGLSILGFNLGIELMQVVLIGVTMPWLWLLARTPTYAWLRPVGAGLTLVAALAWLTERLSGQGNWLTGQLARATSYAPWLLAALVSLALLSWWRARATQPGEVA